MSAKQYKYLFTYHFKSANGDMGWGDATVILDGPVTQDRIAWFKNNNADLGSIVILSIVELAG